MKNLYEGIGMGYPKTTPKKMRPEQTQAESNDKIIAPILYGLGLNANLEDWVLQCSQILGAVT